MLWAHRNIVAKIWSNDHCPPHVTFICAAEQWTARIQFSMTSAHIELMDIKPLKNAPTRLLVNSLMHQTEQNLAVCRSTWWNKQGTVCLDNQMVIRTSAGVVNVAGATGDAGTIIAGTGRFVVKGVVAKVRWQSGEITEETILADA